MYRDTRCPDEVHDPTNEQQQHEKPATPEAITPMLEQHAESTNFAGPPVKKDKANRMLAMVEAGFFQRRELIETGGDQHNTCDHHAGDDAESSQAPIAGRWP